ncbi:MAG: dephospho-CoA kinase [Betaproteobacteria bacterium]
MSFVVGLTGGIGSGKSAVADLFSTHGVVVVDTDAIAHELTGTHGAAMPEIAAQFGDRVVGSDGQLNRVVMRQLVFSEPSAKSRLESILHPLIRRESEQRCQSATSPYVLLVVPLLIETGVYRQRVNRILVVDCAESTQISRVMARSGLDAEEVRAIMETQVSRAVRRAAADDVVVNETDLASLSAQVNDLHQRYLEMAGKCSQSGG